MNGKLVHRKKGYLSFSGLVSTSESSASISRGNILSSISFLGPANYQMITIIFTLKYNGNNNMNNCLQIQNEL
jgi:hypothetical protein